MTKKRMKGYKAFNKDLECRGMQYEIGKEYSLDDEPIICERGFHFCKSIADCYSFYETSEDTRICEITASGTIVTDNDAIKYCTNKIKIVREVKNPREKSNLSKTSSGYRNSGDWNSGNCNSGYRNSGDWNSGDRNSGDCNSGDRNSGDWNSGYRNSGDWNSGYRNSGDRNSGYRNSGDCNSGYRNSGDCNSGDWNSGNCNSGDWNSGDCNSGDWNSGDWNSGIFNTDINPKIKIFDQESDWTFEKWRNSNAFHVMRNCPYTHSDFICEVDMSDEEKCNHPEYKTIGGYIKTFVATNDDKQSWWDALLQKDKQAVFDIPFFDAEKFKLCTGIDVRRAEV